MPLYDTYTTANLNAITGTTTTTPYVLNTTDFVMPYTNTITADRATTMKWTTYVTEEDLDKFAHKIYKIITNHTKIDISEEEFMELLKEDKDE